MKNLSLLLMAISFLYATIIFPMHKELDQTIINKMLIRQDISIEEFIPLFLVAQNNNQDVIIQSMLDYVQLKPDMFIQLIKLTRTVYDDNGDNLAITLATKLNDASLANQCIIDTEQYITEETNKIFKKNLHNQLSIIKASLKNAIEIEHKSIKIQLSEDNWLTSFDVVNQTAIDVQCKILQHIMANQDSVSIAYVGNKNAAINGIYQHCADNAQVALIDINYALSGSVDVLLAPYTLHSQMEDIFKASQDLLRKQEFTLVKEHPLFKYFDKLSDSGVFVATLCSGPNIQDFTNLMLGKHNLHLSSMDAFGNPSLKIFNNVETFFRCLDIFKTHYERVTGKTIVCEISHIFSRIPLDLFCEKYGQVYPELKTMSATEQERFVRLLAIFMSENDILDMSITLKMSVQEKNLTIIQRSFKPIDVVIETNIQKGSNDFLLGQQGQGIQLQNLNGSELAMPYIKDADGVAQLAAMHSVLGNPELNIVDLGGGRGETNAVLKAVKDAGSIIHLLTIEPDEKFNKQWREDLKKFVNPYVEAHHAVRVADVQALQKSAQSVTAAEILRHYKGKKVDVLFASHVIYFLLSDLYKASQNKSLPLNQHPLWKFFKVIRDGGTAVFTGQSGTGARQFRNALLGTFGLNSDDVTPLVSSFFGNMATFLRSFEDFAQRYQKEMGKKIITKMHYAVANVPLGDFSIGKNAETQGFELRDKSGDVMQKDSLASTMMDFYGNWKEQQLLATLTPEKVKEMNVDDVKKLGVYNITEKDIALKRDLAIKTQAAFLHILPVFAPAQLNMQHPNITLEITVQS